MLCLLLTFKSSYLLNSLSSFLPPRQGDYVSTLVCLLVSLLYCQQDYTNTNEQIFTKTPRRTGLGLRTDPISFWCGSRICFHFSHLSPPMVSERNTTVVNPNPRSVAVCQTNCKHSSLRHNNVENLYVEVNTYVTP